MQVQTERPHTGEYLMTEEEGTRSREVGTFPQNQDINPGTILGQVSLGALSAVATAFAGNTGNGVMGTVTVDAGAPTGKYELVLMDPASNAGAFEVFKPDGTLDGTGKVATAYNGLVNFTLADGATDYISGDGFVIVVSAAAATNQGDLVPLSLSAVDGSQNVHSICYTRIITGAGETKRGPVTRRAAEVNGNLLTYPTGASDPQKAAINAQLTALGVIVR